MAKKKIAVLFGGASKEYETSLYSAYDLITGLSPDKYEAVPVGITRAARWLFYPGSPSKILSGEWDKDPDCCSAVLSPDPMHKGFIKIEGSDVTIQRVDAVFSVLHGKYGECGHIQGLCRLSGVPYIGSDHTSAVICSDNILTKQSLVRGGVNVPKFVDIERVHLDDLDECVREVEDNIGYPCHVKAASCSPSFGSSYVENRESLVKGIKIAFSHHHRITVEEHISGRYFECAVYGNTYNLRVTHPAEHITVHSGESFLRSVARPVFDINVPGWVSADMERVAKYAFITLGCKNYAKVGFILQRNLSDSKDSDGTGGDTLYCVRVQNVCGFGRGNLFVQLLENDGMEYSKMLETLIEEAV